MDFIFKLSIIGIIVCTVLVVAYHAIKIINILNPVQHSVINTHIIMGKKKMYIWARFGLRWILEIATISKDNEKYECLVLEGKPRCQLFNLSQEDICYMQRKLCEYLSENCVLMNVTEILNNKGGI